MVSANLSKILQDVQALNDAERQELRNLLEGRAAQAKPKSQVDELAATLAKKGVILTVPPQPTSEDTARFEAWRPIELPGGPLSDDIIRDRR